MQVTRTFNVKDKGLVGEVSLTVPDAMEWKIGDKVLPASSVEYLVNFALQSLQDAYAGAKTLDEAKGAWGKRLDRLIKGEIGTRSPTGGEEPWVAMAVKLFRGQLKAKVDGYDKMEPAARDKAVAALVKVHKQVDAIRAKALEAIEAERKSRDELSALLAD